MAAHDEEALELLFQFLIGRLETERSSLSCCMEECFNSS